MLEVATENISTSQEVAAKTEKTYMVFTTPWCNPCKNYKRKLEDFKENRSDINFKFVDCEEDLEAHDLVCTHGVRSVPTTVVLKGDKTLKTMVGDPTLEEIQEAISTLD